MFYLVIDLVLNSYGLLPSVLIILNLKSKNYLNLGLTVFLLIFFLYDIKFGIIFLLLFYFYNRFFLSINTFFKDIVFLVIFLIITTNDNFLLYFLFNIPFYFASYIFSKKSINISKARKIWIRKKKYLQE